MKNKIWITLLLVFVMLFLVIGCKKKTAEVKPVTLKLAETHAADYPTTKGDQRFADLVKERTNGMVTIEVFHSRQLGEEKAVIEQVQFGAIDFTRVSLGPMAAFYKPFDALQMPYLYRNADHMWKVLNSKIGDRFLAGTKDAGFIGLCWYDSGARSFYTKKPVNNPEDLKGMKIRVMQAAIFVNLVESFGASAQPMPFGEVYSALETGVIDGAENNWPSYYATGHYEVAPYYILDEHTRVPEILVASKISFEKLTPEQQKIVKQAALDSVDYQKKLWADFEKESESKVVAAGNTITRLKDNSAFQAIVQPMYNELSADLQKVVKEIRDLK
jgi:tripartite ATP-independent transporter DctP family solute receptor